MIPLPVLGALPWRFIGWAAVVAATGLLFWRVSEWRQGYLRLERVEAKLELERSCGEKSECAKREQKFSEQIGHETVRIVGGYEEELAAIRARPARVVRLCPDDRGVPNAESAASPGSGTTSAAGVSAATRTDPAVSALYDLARDADEVSARLRAIQEWNRALAAD